MTSSTNLNHKKIHDFIIIGSGASGGVMAYRLTKAGADCVMLEAGKDLGEQHNYPTNEMRSNAQLMWGGASDFATDTRTVILRGKVVGGGSVVNQALLDRFDDVAFDDWRDRSGMSVFSVENFAKYYDRSESLLHLHHYEQQEWNGNAKLYAKAFEKCGYEYKELRRGESNCGGLKKDGEGRENDCIVCLGGCPRNSKQSSAVQSLARARELGLDLRSEFMVQGIVHGKDHVCVYGEQQGVKQILYARRLVLAAGALGSTQILLKSGFKDKLPALGERFFCHPQVMSVGFLEEAVDSHKGALQSLKSSDPRFRPQGFKFENVFAGPVSIGMLHSGFGREHQHYMQRYRNMACIEVCIRDEVPGQIRIDSNGGLIVDKKVTGADKNKLITGNNIVNELLWAMGSYEVMQSKLQIGLHLMGGCAIGERAEYSVVQPDFKLYGHNNIFVTDGGVFPSAPGINPSLSIMAMSHLAADQILADLGNTTDLTTNLIEVNK